VAINPAAVIGPVVSTDFSSSLNVVKKLLDGSVPALPRFGFCLVDVRDIARMHIMAMTASMAAGQRFIGSWGFFWMKDTATVLKQGLGDKARKVPSLVLPDILVRVFAVFDPVVRSHLYDLGKDRRVSSEKARQTLGWTTRPASESILAAAESLEAEGILHLRE
jgi:dihydroflavonol-4-reductase